MMETLFGLALKSFLVAAVTLGLLHLTRRRSAADRSWIAHLGLFALVALPLATLALPPLSIELPAALQPEPAPAPLPARDPRRARRSPPRHRCAGAGRARPGIRLDAPCLCGPGHRAAARHADRLAAPVRAARPRPGTGRPGVAQRARPRPAPHGVQERHRLADQFGAQLADQLGPDAPGHPAQRRSARRVGRGRGDHCPRTRARRTARLGQIDARPRRHRHLLVQPARLGAGPRSAPVARGSRRRRRPGRRHRRHRLRPIAGRGGASRMPRHAARRARHFAGQGFADPPCPPRARFEPVARSRRPFVGRGLRRRHAGHGRTARGTDLRPGSRRHAQRRRRRRRRCRRHEGDCGDGQRGCRNRQSAPRRLCRRPCRAPSPGRSAAARGAAGRRQRHAQQQRRIDRHPGRWHDRPQQPERRDGHRPRPRRQRTQQAGHAQPKRRDLLLRRCAFRPGDGPLAVRHRVRAVAMSTAPTRASSTGRSR